MISLCSSSNKRPRHLCHVFRQATQSESLRPTNSMSPSNHEIQLSTIIYDFYRSSYSNIFLLLKETFPLTSSCIVFLLPFLFLSFKHYPLYYIILPLYSNHCPTFLLGSEIAKVLDCDIVVNEFANTFLFGLIPKG